MTLAQVVFHLTAINERQTREHVLRCMEAMFAMADGEKAKDYFDELIPSKQRKVDNVKSAEHLRALLGG